MDLIQNHVTKKTTCINVVFHIMKIAYNLLNQSHRGCKKNAYILLGFTYQVAKLVYKENSYVGLPTTGPQIDDYVLLQSFLAKLKLVPF